MVAIVATQPRQNAKTSAIPKTSTVLSYPSFIFRFVQWLSRCSRPTRPRTLIDSTMVPSAFGQMPFRNRRSNQYRYHQQRNGGRKDPPCHDQQEFDDHIHVSLPPGSHMQRLRPRPASFCKGTIRGGVTKGSDEGPTLFQRLRPEPASNWKKGLSPARHGAVSQPRAIGAHPAAHPPQPACRLQISRCSALMAV